MTPADDASPTRPTPIERARRWLRAHPQTVPQTIQELRATSRNSPPIAHTTITPTLVQGPGASADGPEQTPAEWVLAPDADPDRRILYLHGGGYVTGSPGTHRNLTSRISAASGMAVLALDYRLAPEHPCPAAIRDTVPAFAWMTANGPNGPGKASAAFIAGDSSGGGLAIGAMVKIRDLGDRQADAAFTLSAWADLTLSGKSWQTRADEDLMTSRAFTDRLIEWVLPGGLLTNFPLISPVFADLQDLPPLYLIAGDHEVFRDDTARLAALAHMMGVDVREEIYPEMPHVFPAFPDLPESKQVMAKIGEFLRANLPAVWAERPATDQERQHEEEP
ncbi:MAG: Acetyl esterase/lipase [Chloroflexi bacterium]|nr:MAG: Acetyl esterase/lipase [Chloroflexota bacterium]